MSTASPKTKELARRLLAFETAQNESSDSPVEGAAQVIAELRRHLIRLAGVDGFRSLLSRALTLAKAEVPSLDMVRVGADGAVEGFDAIEQGQEAVAKEQAGIVLVAQLLELLVTFVGESLTLRLLRDKWPEASLDGMDLRTEETP